MIFVSAYLIFKVYTYSHTPKCIEDANYRIENFKDLKNLFQAIEKNKSSFDRPFRPDWDTYFMKIALAVKARSNCMKRRYVNSCIKIQELFD